MKYFLLIITLFISVLSFGQNSEPETKPDNQKQSKIRLTPFFSYDFNLSTESTINGIFTNHYSYKEFNYRVGIDIEYKFTNTLSISSGLNYSARDFSFYSDCASCDPLSFDYTTELRFLEIPLIGIYTYHIIDFEVFGQLGIINQLNVSLDIFEENYRPGNVKEYNLNGKIGLGISYPIIKKHRLFIASDYVFGLTDIYENYNYKNKTLGIRMGVQFLL